MDEQQAISVIKQIAALDPLDPAFDGSLIELQGRLQGGASHAEPLPVEAAQILNEIANLDCTAPDFDRNLQELQERFNQVNSR